MVRWNRCSENQTRTLGKLDATSVEPALSGESDMGSEVVTGHAFSDYQNRKSANTPERYGRKRT